MLTIKNILDNATLDADQQLYLYDNVLDAWATGSPDLIRILESPMNSGKTTTLLMATCWAEVYNNPERNLILYVAPRNELKKDALAKVESFFDGKSLICSDNSIKEISIYDQDVLGDYFNLNRVAKKTCFNIPDNTIVFASISIQWLTNPVNLALVMKLNKGFIYVDEPHIGLKIADASSMLSDAGRYAPSTYDPVWLPAMLDLTLKGHKVVGSTATTSASQSGSITGVTKFKPLPVMPKRSFKACFPVSHCSPDVYSVYADFKQFWVIHLMKTTELINSISADTWSKAATLNVVPCMPLFFVKAGAENAQRSIPMFAKSSALGDSLYNDLWNFHRRLNRNSIFAVNTSYHTALEKKSTSNYRNQSVKDLHDIMGVLNDPMHNMHDGGLCVIHTGTAGMNVHRLDTVVYLSDPQNLSDIVDSQVQAMGRIMRFPFNGMRSHADMRDKINTLDISLSEKYLLCQYVVYKCLNHVFHVDSPLMRIAVDEFSEGTMTEEGGMEYYMSHMTCKSSQNSSVTPSISLNYNASALNATYKKQHCECCTVVDMFGTTSCERDARKNLEKIEGPMTNARWSAVWFNVLHLHHKDVDHFNYDPKNLITACPNMHMGITIFEGHATKQYPTIAQNS